MEPFFKFLEKVSRIIDVSVERGSVLAESPHGALEASTGSVVIGTPLQFTIHLDPTDLQYPVLFYNVRNVQLFQLRNNQLELAAELPAADNQELFTWEWTPGAQDAGQHRFVAFVTSKLLPFLPLEVDDDGSLDVSVTNPTVNHTPVANDDSASTVRGIGSHHQRTGQRRRP